MILYWIYGHRPLVAESWQWADDGLFLRHAEAIQRYWSGLSPKWLGDYDGRILAKAPMLGLLVATLHIFGIPLRMLEFAGFLLLPWIFRRALAPHIRLPTTAMVVLCIALVACPCLPIELRLLRTPLHLISGAICLIAATALFVRSLGPVRRQLPWAALLGIAFAVTYLNREEITLFIPYLATALVAASCLTWINYRHVAALAPAAVCIGVACVPISLVSSLNYRDYGLFGTSMRRAPAFAHLFQVLTSLQPETRKPYVPILTATRLRAYEVSPSFARLKPFLEGKTTDHLARNPNHLFRGGFQPTDREFFITTFEWALRDSTYLAGIRSAGEAEIFFAQCAREIETAIREGRIHAGHSGPALLCPSMPGDYWRIANAAVRYADGLYALKGAHLPTRIASSGPANDVLHMAELTGDVAAPINMDKIPRPLAALRQSIYAVITWSERLMYGITSLGAMVYACWVARCHRRDFIRLTLATSILGLLATVVLCCASVGVIHVLGWPNFLMWPASYHYFALAPLCCLSATGIVIVAYEIAQLRLRRDASP